MRGLLLSTSAMALLCLAPLAATTYAADKPAEKTTTEKVGDTLSDAWASFKQGTKEAWDATVKTFDDMTRKTQEDIILPKALPGALSAKAVIGTPIQNGKEGRVGSISDIVLGQDSHVDAIVVSDGGFLGINNAQIAVKPSLISIRRDDKGALTARTNVTESQLDAASASAFTTKIQAMKEDFKKPEVKTASRLIGSSVVGADGKTIGSVNDILLSPVGEARYALLSTGGTMGVGAKVVAVPVSSLTFTKAGDPLKTSMTAEQLGKLAPVRTQASAT
jgi:uncharacterized protein YrrD